MKGSSMGDHGSGQDHRDMDLMQLGVRIAAIILVIIGIGGILFLFGMGYWWGGG